MSLSNRCLRFGKVMSFDEYRGVGTILDEGCSGTDPASAGLFFHCTAIADGSRSIAPGREVVYELGAGSTGCWEAVLVRPLPEPGSQYR
ncbi:MAG: cold shock domain-containing protein [Actinomycetota bacterium]|nr:cold shock domain-containing protein [Actinomycetota bacterium]